MSVRSIAPNFCEPPPWGLGSIADRFVEWMRRRPIDLGATCSRCIRRCLHNRSLVAPPSEWDAGNGAVMRMASASLFILGDDGPLPRLALERARLMR